MNEEASLIKWCIQCGSKCCIMGKRIGLPILSKEEAEKYRQIGVEIKEEISPSGGKYWVFVEKEDDKRCVFLADNGKCKVQKMKPLDCACYPVKAIHEGNGFKFFIDIDCPAVKHLDRAFIERLKQKALESASRFDKTTHDHWIERYIGWVKNSGMPLDEFLKARTN
jgi:Fe-S-cluster containining protein